jgi:hypothetical protein
MNRVSRENPIYFKFRAELKGIQPPRPVERIPEGIRLEFPDQIVREVRQVGEEFFFSVGIPPQRYQVDFASFEEETGLVTVRELFGDPEKESCQAQVKMTPGHALYLALVPQSSEQAAIGQEVNVDLKMNYPRFKALVDAAKAGKQR